jgi:GNAT superfamily N-acetyltransferase
VIIRPLRSDDLDGAVAASDAVGWSGRRTLFEFYSAREDTALFVADRAGEIVGTGGATLFQGTPATGWVHDIIVRPDHQRTGLGARLTEATVDWLRARSVVAVLLMATESGRPVYERLGFVGECDYGAFAWPEAPDDGTEIERLQPSQLAAVLDLDREATGENRGRFIESLSDNGWVALRGGAVVGFHLACPWGGGPTISHDFAAGIALLHRVSGLPNHRSRLLGIPDGNAATIDYLADLGIVAQYKVTRMWLGDPPAWCPDMIFGVFNFGVG